MDREGTHFESWTKVHVAETPFEADILGKALRDTGIPFLLRKHEETAYNGIFIPQRGWASIWVPRKWKHKAEETIQEILASYPR